MNNVTTFRDDSKDHWRTTVSRSSIQCIVCFGMVTSKKITAVTFREKATRVLIVNEKISD